LVLVITGRDQEEFFIEANIGYASLRRGSSTIYDLSATANGFGILPGSSLTFTAFSPFDPSPPSSVPWFAYGKGQLGGEYLGGGNFNNNAFPGLEGVASVIRPVPLPDSLVLFGIGMGVLAGLVGWKRKSFITPDTGGASCFERAFVF